MCLLSLTDAIYPEGTPWILPRLDPGTTQIFLPEKSHEQRSLAGYSPQGHKEWNVTEQVSTPRQCKYGVLTTGPPEKSTSSVKVVFWGLAWWPSG